MAGIYIHIPYCRKACNYCDFHFSTHHSTKEELVKALIKEIGDRKDYLGSASIETIYFGGGTPSILSKENLDEIFNSLYKNFGITKSAEISFEANPDDLNKESIHALLSSPINRFSIGIQSFFEEDLRWMNRSHNAQQAKNCILELQDTGYCNISLDLIFGYSLLSQKKWEENISKALELNIPHVSTYGMTLEKRTLLGKQYEKGIYKGIDDNLYSEQYTYLIKTLNDSDYIDYEISNFAKSGFESRHNSHYWERIPYLGIGPSAHSFDGNSRSWNISNNSLYIKGIVDNKRSFEEEILTEENHFNEYILTALRTRKGIYIPYLQNHFEPEWVNKILKKAEAQIKNGFITLQNNQLQLTSIGKLVSDRIIQEFV